MDWNHKVVLVTGGTGSFEKKFIYASSTNPQWLMIEQIQGMVAPIEAVYELGKLA